MWPGKGIRFFTAVDLLTLDFVAFAQTSLAAQLKILAGTGGAGGKDADTRGLSHKHKASFLFDAAQASDMDAQTIFHLGLNGLAELRQLDERFAPFEATLFASEPGGAGVRSLDRDAQSRKMNAGLDQSIAGLLRALSPYFLHRSAHKVIEYLIRRFSVHEHNIDAMLECALPFHESTLFARLLQLMKVNGAQWDWLKVAQKNGAPVARGTLVQRCLMVRCATCVLSGAHPFASLAQDHSILTFVCDLAKNSVAVGTFVTLPLASGPAAVLAS